MAVTNRPLFNISTISMDPVFIPRIGAQSIHVHIHIYIYKHTHAQCRALSGIVVGNKPSRQCPSPWQSENPLNSHFTSAANLPRQRPKKTDGVSLIAISVPTAETSNVPATLQEIPPPFAQRTIRLDAEGHFSFDLRALSPRPLPPPPNPTPSHSQGQP